ncbi:MAG: energy transducer TonB, partial [Bryobacteraceae bacterium]|jgi:TonB family protein
MFLSFTTVCSAALIAARLAVWMFPMQAPAQVQVSPNYRVVTDDGPGVVVEPGAKILHRTSVFYPSGVTTSGTVIVESSVNAKGEVTDAHVVSGPDELRNAALSSVLNWHFSPEGGLPPTVQSSIRFDAAPRTAEPVPVAAAPSVAHASKYLKSIDTSALPQELVEKVSAALPVHVGDPFGNDDVARVRAALKEVDEHLAFGFKDGASDVTLTVTLRSPRSIQVIPNYRIVNDGTPGSLSEAGPAVSVQTAAAALPPPASGVQRIRVGGNVQSSNLAKKVTPTYPALAKQARIQGTVRFTALIGADGRITSLQLIEGHPLLVESAQEAVAQWQYKPTLLNGDAVEVVTQIDVNYTLAQ